MSGDLLHSPSAGPGQWGSPCRLGLGDRQHRFVRRATSPKASVGTTERWAAPGDTALGTLTLLSLPTRA